MNENSKNELLDQTAFKPLTNAEKQIADDGGRTGGAMSAGETSAADLARAIGASGSENNRNAELNRSGVANQTINPNDLDAATESGASGDDADLSGGESNLNATTDAPVEQNDYNR